MRIQSFAKCCKLVKRPIKNLILCHYSCEVKIFENKHETWWGPVGHRWYRSRVAKVMTSIFIAPRLLNLLLIDWFTLSSSAVCEVMKYEYRVFTPAASTLEQITSALQCGRCLSPWRGSVFSLTRSWRPNCGVESTNVCCAGNATVRY
jgi:hypothetical protein